MKKLIPLALLATLALGCSGLRSAVPRLRHGPADQIGFVVAKGDGGFCLQRADGIVPVPVASMKLVDLAKADLLGRDVVVRMADGFAVSWTAFGKRALESVPAIDRNTCEPLVAASAGAMTEQEFLRRLSSAVADEGVVAERGAWSSILRVAGWIGRRCNVPGLNRLSSDGAAPEALQNDPCPDLVPGCKVLRASIEEHIEVHKEHKQPPARGFRIAESALCEGVAN